MRNQTKIKQLLIVHLKSVMDSTRTNILLTPWNVESVIGEAIDRCYEADKKSLSLKESSSDLIKDKTDKQFQLCKCDNMCQQLDCSVIMCKLRNK
jgi:hypothetical protein